MGTKSTPTSKDRDRHWDDQYRRDGHAGMTRMGSNLNRSRKPKPKPRNERSWVVDLLKGYWEVQGASDAVSNIAHICEGREGDVGADAVMTKGYTTEELGKMRVRVVETRDGAVVSLK